MDINGGDQVVEDVEAVRRLRLAVEKGQPVCFFRLFPAQGLVVVIGMSCGPKGLGAGKAVCHWVSSAARSGGGSRRIWWRGSGAGWG